MITRTIRKLRSALLGAATAALIVTTTTALAGSGVGGVFNLGQTNTVNQKTTLTGATADPELVVQNTGSGTALNLIGGAGAAPFRVNSNTKVASLNADFLDGLDSTGFWKLGGNTVGSPGVLGTTTNQPLELKVNGQRVLRLQPNATSPDLIGGHSGNAVTAGAFAATISGGGVSLSVNRVSDDDGTVGGGAGNLAGNGDGDPSNSAGATVGGGSGNTASRFDSVVAGGLSNRASGLSAAVAGGIGNTASGDDSADAGGANNTASGNFSFAAGRQAKANHQGTFVWADSQGADMASSGTDQFIARAQGHFFLQSDSTLDDQSGFINTSTGAFLSTGGTWTNASSRSLKAGFTPISPLQILEKVAALPLTSWRYKAEPRVRHIGPVAEDFHRAFRLGDNARSIGTVDADGVALAAIQGLYRQNRILERRVRRLERELHLRNRASEGRAGR